MVAGFLFGRHSLQEPTRPPARTYRHPVLEGEALQRLPRLDPVLDASLADRGDRGPNQTAVGPGAAGAEQADSPIRQCYCLVGHVRGRRWGAGGAPTRLTPHGAAG